MIKLPFLEDAHPKAATRTTGSMANAMRDYQPLLACWLVQAALLFGRHSDASGPFASVLSVFGDRDFLELTGLPDDIADEEGGRKAVERARRTLRRRLNELSEHEVSADLPLFRNISLLAEPLQLSDADKVLLTFAVALDIFPQFRNAMMAAERAMSTTDLCKLLSYLSGVPVKQFEAATADDAPLIAAGLVSIDYGICDLDDKLDLMDRLGGILLSPHKDTEQLIARFMRRAPAAELSIERFPHLEKDATLLIAYLRQATAAQIAGSNVLLYGQPGVGKTEFARALAAGLGVDLYEIAFADGEGAPIRGESRLRAYSFCQRLLARRRNALLLFDEIEDVFPSEATLLAAMFEDEDRSSSSLTSGKAWVNRILEQNAVPAIWISNRVSHIDQAYLRRFDYSVRFPIPPQPVRREIAAHHLARFEPSEDWLDAIAANEQITPGQLERAAKVAALAADSDNARALELVSQTLERSQRLLGQTRAPQRPNSATAYDLSLINSNLDIPRVIEGLKRRARGSFCFYGPAGTGKSELARYIADAIGRPMLLRRASDILSPWVGVTETNLAEMFADAREQGAVLVLDEADSFLADRRGASVNWEVTQVNELLTQMEAFDGVFICTTNLMERLDQASLRRFTVKARFDYLNADQRWEMFQRELARLGGDAEQLAALEDEVRELDRLTPGDFAVVARQFHLVGDTPDARRFLHMLREERNAKQPGAKPMGFLSKLQ